MDTPGFSQIDFNKDELDKIVYSFKEFRNSNCQFKDCKHLKEKGCSIIGNKNILKSRYENYLKFVRGEE